MSTPHIYRYHAVSTQENQRFYGWIFAHTSKEIIAYLKKFELIPLRIYQIPHWLFLLIIWFQRLDPRQRVNRRFKYQLSRQFYDLLSAHFDITTIVHSLIHTLRRLDLKLKLQKVLFDLLRGYSLADSLAYHTNIFNQTEIYLIRHAEEQSALTETFGNLQAFFAESLGARNTLILWVIPLIGSITLIVLVCNYIANHYLPLYEYDIWLQAKSFPAIAQTYMAFFSGSLLVNSFIGFGMLVCAYYVIKLLGKFKWLHMRYEIILSHIPIIREQIRLNNLVQFTSALGLSLQAKIPLHHSLQQAAHTLTNPIYQQQLQQLAAAVAEGFDIVEEISKCKLFSLADLFLLKTALKSAATQANIIQITQFAKINFQMRRMVVNNLIRFSLLVLLFGLIGFTLLVIYKVIYISHL